MGSVTAKSQLVIAEIFEVLIGAAGFVAGHAPDAAVYGLAFEALTARLDFGDDVAPRERSGAGALVQPVDCIEDRVSATRAGVGELGLQRCCSSGFVLIDP